MRPRYHTIVPPHTCPGRLDTLGYDQIPEYPEKLKGRQWSYYFETEIYPKEIIEYIYRKIVSDPANGREHLYKLVFDIIILSGIARDLNNIAAGYKMILLLLGANEDKTLMAAFMAYLEDTYCLPGGRRKRNNKAIAKIAAEAFLRTFREQE